MQKYQSLPNSMRIILYTILIASMCWSIGCKKAEERPNIIFIMSDDHTSQAWSIYGGVLKDYVVTPNIERLSDQGAMLTNVFCTNAICTPSRGSIMTGRYSHQNGIYTLSEGLHPDSNNIAKVLQGAGYNTAIIGKWHLKEKPSGFDHFQVLPGQGRYRNPILKSAMDWDAGGQEYEGFSADVIGDESIKWLKKRQGEKPFFLMTHFKATHEPFDYPDRYLDLYRSDTLPEPASLYDFGPETTGRTFTGQKLEILGSRWVAFQQDPDRYGNPYPDMPFTLEGKDSLEARKAIYQKFVKDFIRSGAAIDDNIGKILDYLDEAGLSGNTIVIYTSDQGYFLGEHGFFDKRMIYEESMRMPFVIRYPKEIEAGSMIDDLILNIDFPALFADYSGLDIPDFVEGKSFRQNLHGSTPPDWRTSIYYRYWLHQRQRPAHFGIRDHRYKLAFFYGQPLGMPGTHKEITEPGWEFYDLQEDPHEIKNAYNDPIYKSVIDSLKEEMLYLKASVGDDDALHPEMLQIINDYWK